MKFAPTKTVERLDLQAAACVSGSLSVVMSADLLPMADIGRQGWHGRKVPEPDSHTAAKGSPYSITSSEAGEHLIRHIVD